MNKKVSSLILKIALIVLLVFPTAAGASAMQIGGTYIVRVEDQTYQQYGDALIKKCLEEQRQKTTGLHLAYAGTSLNSIYGVIFSCTGASLFNRYAYENNYRMVTVLWSTTRYVSGLYVTNSYNTGDILLISAVNLMDERGLVFPLDAGEYGAKGGDALVLNSPHDWFFLFLVIVAIIVIYKKREELFVYNKKINSIEIGGKNPK